MAEDGSCWHYLPVWREEEDGGRGYTVVEVHLDEDGRLEDWTENPAAAPWGEAVEELYFDLTAMLLDCMRWHPVCYTSLAKGVRFVERHPGEVLQVRHVAQPQQRLRRDH